MRKSWMLVLVGVAALFLAGCGGGDSRLISTEWIDSDRTVDADLTLDLVKGGPPLLALASVNGHVLAGVTVDFWGTPVADTRGFLYFPLDRIPLGASIRYAGVTIYLNQVTLRNSSLPTPFFLDLIDTDVFPPPVQATDYSASYAATRSLDFYNTDQGKWVEIEVTSLMREAQRLELPSFEVRIGFDEAAYIADINTTRGLIEIDDLSRRPFLTVEYEN